jgi:4-amino-4-deoxychorismate lyase
MNLIETIKYQDAKFFNLKLHQSRMDNSIKQLFGFENKIHLSLELKNHTKNNRSKLLQKCRILYNKKIQKIDFTPYSFPKIESLKIITNNEIEYGCKYENRDLLNFLYSQKQDFDDILMVKNGLITDTSYCNILFFNGEKWLTPEKPLLKGVQRQYLINNEIVETANISISDLKYFTKVRLINAMISFDEKLDISINKISK